MKIKLFSLLFVISFFSIGQTNNFSFKTVKVSNIENNILEPQNSSKTVGSIQNRDSSSTNSGAGTTFGQLSVSLTGGANYDIPIAVPQGVNGVHPIITLSYDSQIGNGIAGYGWNLKGISTITRMPSTKFYDGVIDGVDFDLQDRFNLDGQRLVLKSGTYGGNGTVYETEKYSNLKVISYGVSPYGAQYGPSYFIVYYPDGSKAAYGQSVNSRSKTNYSITYWQNPQGLRISYAYSKTHNTQFLTNIFYGGQLGGPSINEVRFTYDDLTGSSRWDQAYVENNNLARSRVLNKIDTYSEGDKYRSYELEHTSSYGKYKRLSSVKEISGDDSLEYAPIEFEYTDTSASLNQNAFTAQLGLSNIDQTNASALPLDFRGDGRLDFIIMPKENRDKFWIFEDLSTGVTNYPTQINTGNEYEAIHPKRLINNNLQQLPGQGLTIIQNEGYLDVEFSVNYAGSSSALNELYTRTWTAPSYSVLGQGTRMQQEYLSGDFNGDGITDVIAVSKRDYSPSAANFKRVHWINLKYDINSNYTSLVGELMQELEEDDKLYTGDFNGNGKTDFLHLANGKLLVYELDTNNQLSLLWEQNDADLKVNEPLLLGDYNGDGKTDFIEPDAPDSGYFHHFYSTGTTFNKASANHVFDYKLTNLAGGSGIGNNLIPLDVDGDGKTDIVRYRTSTFADNSQGNENIRVYYNRGFSDLISNSGAVELAPSNTYSNTGPLSGFPIPIFLNNNEDNKKLELASISGQQVNSYKFQKDHREDMLIRKVISNGVTQELYYNSLDEDEYNEDGMQIYWPLFNQTYPNVDIKTASGTKVVSMLKRVVNNTPTIKRLFIYEGATYNSEGLGFLGFTGMASSNWHTNNSDRIFTMSKFDTDMRGVMVANYSLAFDFNFTIPTSSSNYISKTIYDYSHNLLSNNVLKYNLEKSLAQNGLTGSFKSTRYEYDSYNNPTEIKTDYFGGSTIQTFEYENFTNTIGYYIGKLKKTTNSSTIGSEIFNSEKKFEYNGFLINRIKSKGHNTDFDEELYNHDNFGNVVSKSTIPNGATPRVIQFEYDSSGRFLTKHIDIDGLETLHSYNTSKGILTNQIDSYGREARYEYDSFNRLITSKDYLNNSSYVSYGLLSGDSGYTITETSDDGSWTKTLYDPLMRSYSVQNKDALDQLISQNIEYDKFDRPWRQSEPFEGVSASQWNETTFDFYGRPTVQNLYTGKTINISYDGLSTTASDGIKTVTTTIDGLGNTLSVNDLGGLITYDYYGNGNLKSTTHNGSTITLEQDGWGRKTKLIDPSAGTFEYEYGDFGELLSETGPKGSTTFGYGPTGRLLSQSISGDNTPNTDITYSYDPNLYFITAINQLSDDGNNSTLSYIYDSYNRITNIEELNQYALFEKQFSYDSFGRVNTELSEATLLSNNKSSSNNISYSYSNGALTKIRDLNSGQSVWDLKGINARGQLLQEDLGSSLTHAIEYDDYGYRTKNKLRSSSEADLMELTTSFDAERGTLNTRTNSLFSWSETFNYDDLDRLLSYTDNESGQTQSYDSSGRIIWSNEIGDYNYSGSSYQLTTIDLNVQGDLHYQQNELQQAKFNAFQKPYEVLESGKDRVGFQYNAFMGRSHMFYDGLDEDILDRNKRKHYSFDGSMEISYDDYANETTFNTYVGGDATSAKATWRSWQVGFTTVEDYYYLHRDYLGSIILITDSSGAAKEKRHFDAWGNIKKLTDGNDNPIEEFKYSDRGYTGHEHLQGVGLIHMNARLYDPKLRRFLSPDRYVQDPTNSQNYNRYAYAFNNPLMYTDPTGNFNSGPEGGGLTAGEQAGLGSLIATAVQLIDWNAVAEGLSTIVRGIGRAFRDLFGGGGSKEKPPKADYQNINSLTSDPGAGSSGAIPVSSFGSSGQSSGGLGVSEGAQDSWMLTKLKQTVSFGFGMRHGAMGGLISTGEFLGSLTTAQGWRDVGQGFVNLVHMGNLYSGEGMILRAQMAASISNYIDNIPNMSAYQVGYDLGFGAEKVAESVLLTRGAGAVVNGVKAIRVSNTLKTINNTAKLSSNGVKLNTHLGLLERYGQAGSRTLQNGRIRYYGEITPANNPGAMIGRRVVKEWNPKTNLQRVWMETLDNAGNIRIVRPQFGNIKGFHYYFDELGKYLGFD